MCLIIVFLALCLSLLMLDGVDCVCTDMLDKEQGRPWCLMVLIVSVIDMSDREHGKHCYLMVLMVCHRHIGQGTGEGLAV